MIAWKPVPEYPKYFVSNQGDVVSTVKGFRRLKPTLATWKSRTVMLVTIRNSEGQKSCKVHRLVAKCFLPKADCGMTVNHKDGNTLNNHISNLEWLTLKDNIRHAWKSGHIGSHPNYFKRGVYRMGHKKLTYQQVKDIRFRKQCGESMKSMAKEYKVSYACIRKAALGISWNSPIDSCIGEKAAT